MSYLRPPGIGLGLFTLRKRVEALGGQCGCNTRSDGGHGASFWFSFPYRPDEVAAAAAAMGVDLGESESAGVAGGGSDGGEGDEG